MCVQFWENHWCMVYFMFCTFLRALETNKYNHITATYFLLAERILREKQEKEIQTRSASPSNIKAQFRWEFRSLNGFFFFFNLPYWEYYWIAQVVKYLFIANLKCLRSAVDTSEALQKSVTNNIFNSYAFHEMTNQFEVCVWSSKFSHLLGKGVFIDLRQTCIYNMPGKKSVA